MTSRRLAAWTLVVGSVGFVLLYVVLVPWNPVPWPVEPVQAQDWFTHDQLARAEEHARWMRVWSWSGLGVTLLTGLLLARSAASGWLSRRLVGGRPWLRTLLAVAVVTIVVWLIGLPFEWAAWHQRRDVGLSTQHWSGVLADSLQWQAVAIVATVLVVLAWRGLVRVLPRAWPPVAALLAATLTLVATYAWPLLIEPLFNDFLPLPDGSLRTQVLALAEREQVPVDDVLVADASRRTTALNAYVSGYGSSRRVVLYDTLVAREPEPVVLSVTAHELAHAKYDDPLIGAVLGAAGAVAGVGALGLLTTARPVRRRWGDPASPGSVVLVLALAPVAALLTAPIGNGASRQIETRADVAAIDATGDARTFVELQCRLAVANVSDPTPPSWSQWVFGTHPTTLERIATAWLSPRSATAGTAPRSRPCTHE